MIKVLICLAILGLVLVSCPGCGPSGPPTFLVTDQLGRVVGLYGTPERIASLDPGVTEILYALGLGDRVVGVSSDSDYPMEAREKPTIGDASVIDMDKLDDLSPDLVIARTYDENQIIPRLEDRKLTVFALAPKNLDGVLEEITLIGEITQQPAAASSLVAGLETRIKAVTDKTDAIPESQRPTVFYLYYYSPLYTAGQGTVEDDLIAKAGGINVAHDLDGYSPVEVTDIVDVNPQVMLSSFQIRVGTTGDPAYEFLLTDPDLAATDARRDGRVWSMWDTMLTRMGPRLVDGLEELTMLIYLVPAPSPPASP